MRVIALSLLLVAPEIAFAETHADVVDLFASMTAALSEENAAGFMKAFDRGAGGLDALQRDIEGLVLTYEIGSSVEVLQDEGDGEKRTVDLDWFLELRSRQTGGPNVRRRELIHCELALRGKRWRIVSMTPVTLFRP